METLLLLIGIGVLLLCIILTLFILLVYSGLFEKVEVGAGKPPIGEAVIAYKFARGPYKEAGPLFTEVCKIAPKNKCLGIYYDDPKTVEASCLRYIVASVLSEGGGEVDEELKKKFEEEGFKVISLPEVDYAVRTTFPHVSTLSIFIAISKVYPQLAEYIKEHKLCAHPFLEIYQDNTIYFMAPLSKHEDFYVPESLKCLEEDKQDDVENITSCNLPMSASEGTEPSLLSHAMKAGVLANMDEEKGDEISGMGDSGIATSFVSSEASGAASRDENGSDEGSTSSFEEVRMENGENVDESQKKSA
ncbi:testis-expressed protein 264-like [Pomacea canaliculata]|nr:testis-expressed protein 264-like [Pomacea canaliculata]